MIFRRKREVRKKGSEEAQIVYETKYEKPNICAIDIQEEVFHEIARNGYNCTAASVGATIRIATALRESGHLVIPNYDIPDNLHEYDVIILNAKNDKEESYNSKTTEELRITGQNYRAFMCKYPENHFNPIPYGVTKLREMIEQINHKAIVILFASERQILEYREVLVKYTGTETVKGTKHSNLQIYNAFPRSHNRFGKEIQLASENSPINSILDKYRDSMEYEVVFDHPTEPDYTTGGMKKIKEFIPLLVNRRGDILSFFHTHSNLRILVFPQMTCMGEFLVELFTTHLPNIYPEIFPAQGQFLWLDSGEYPVPGELELRAEKAEIDKRFKLAKRDNKDQLNTTIEKYGFLRTLLYESGDELVDAVKEFLAWIGFEDVEKVDESTDGPLEEDLRVETEEELLIVEVKGIGGTSKDSDCAQISKIRSRRSEERGKFDVYALYVVNHQRYIPPKERRNPPFSDDQVKDALLEKRAMVSTFELYKSYMLSQLGLISKEEIRNLLHAPGVVSLRPQNWEDIGKPKQLYKDGNVIIIDMKDKLISVGDIVIGDKGDSYTKLEVMSLQVNDENVRSISNAEVGIRFDKPVTKKTKLYMQL